MLKATESQLSAVQALIWRLNSLGDRAWAIRADILVACGTVRLAGLPRATVLRVADRLRGRIELIEQVNNLKRAGQ